MKTRVKTRRTPAAGGTRKFRIMVMVLALAFGPTLMSAPAANAGTYDDLGGKPGQDCRPKTLGNAAGSGFPGLVDPAPAPIVANGPSPAAAEAANTAQAAANKTIYHVYGWAGYSWETCATGGPVQGAEALGNTTAWSDNEVGSAMLKAATGIAALNTGIAKMAANPGAVMKPLDDIVTEVSKLVRSALVDLWLPLLLMAAAALIAVNALNKNVRKAVASIGAIFAALLGIAYLSFAPVQAAQAMDGVAGAAQTAVLQKALEFNGKQDIPADETWGVLYTDNVIFPLWADGLTNWGQADKRLSPNLDKERLPTPIKAKQKFEAFTPTQAYQIRSYAWGAEKTEQTTKDRRDAWNTIGEASQTKDAPTRAFTGQDGNRAGTGFMALASTASIASFSIPANLMTFFAMIAFRMLPIVGLVGCLLLGFEPTRPLAYKMGRFFLNALINGVVLGTFAALHLAIVGAAFGSTIGFLWATVITAIISVVFFKVTKPLRTLKDTVVGAGKAVGRGARAVLPQRAIRVKGNNHSAGNQYQPSAAGQGQGTNAQPQRNVSPLKRQAPIAPPVFKAPQMVMNRVSQTAGTATHTAGKVPPVKAVSKVMPGTPGQPGKAGHGKPGTAGHSRTNRQQRQGTQPNTGSGYSSLQQARKSDGQRVRQVRQFVPPNSTKAPQQNQNTAPQKGDRPTQKKFQPPAARLNQRDANQPVQPLKSRS